MMNTGSAIPILFGIAFVIAGLGLYRAARRASPDRRYFRMGAYTQTAVLIFAGVLFIAVGILSQ